MKKALVCLLIILSLCLCQFGVGEGYESMTSAGDKLKNDFREMDIELLLYIREILDEVISERIDEVEFLDEDDGTDSSDVIESEPFSEGLYEAGKNIKPGTYRFDFTNMKFGGIVNVYDSDEDYNNSNPREHYIAANSEASYTITLDEGNILSISLAAGVGKITISKLESSWVP